MAKALELIFKLFRGARGGWEIKLHGEEIREGRIWVRRRTWREWWRRVRGGGNEEVVTERTSLLG